MKRLLFLLLAAIVLAGCPQPSPSANATNATNATITLPANATLSERACATDADCACGVHVVTRECFFGNKQFVDVSQQCPDYCTGIAGNLETRCVSGECRIVQRARPPQPFCGYSTNGPCAADVDCIRGGCSGQVCQSRTEKPVITTCEYRECYEAERYGLACRCVAGACRWS
ncbi:MAG: eight-cysteine-cluster domain-containing protein [Candidatus Micrarchaeia archaeon]